MSRNPYKNPNPQGKGLVSVLAHWQETRPRAVAQKSTDVLLLDWFVSTLVLSARFHFRPVPGQQYFLYARRGELKLSLVGPEEWRGSAPYGGCLGRCALRDDMTWALEPHPELAEREDLQELLAELAASFSETLDSDQSLDSQLPGYRRQLPYFQRLLATGLGSSLRGSVDSPRLLAAPAREALSQGGAGLSRRLLASAQRVSASDG
jgi:hypothetical protein